MSFFEGFSGRKLLLAAFSVATLSLLSATAARADQFQYQFTGTAAGLIDGTPVGDTPFTLTFDEDTSAIVNAGSGFYRYNNISGILVAESQTFTLTGVSLVVNSNSDSLGHNVDFYDPSFTNGLGMSDPALDGYALASNIALPVTGTNLTPSLGTSTFTLVDSGNNDHTLQFTADPNQSLGFTATDLTAAATPEPSSLLLLGSGLSGLAMLRRRLLKA